MCRSRFGKTLDVRSVSCKRLGIWDDAFIGPGIDERAKEFLKLASKNGCSLALQVTFATRLIRYGPCYWGHNDMDYMHPWKDPCKSAA